MPFSFLIIEHKIGLKPIDEKMRESESTTYHKKKTDLNLIIMVSEKGTFLQR